MNRQGLGLWIAVIALLVLDIGIHCVRAQDDTPKVLKTQDLQILDSGGNEIGDLTADPKTGGGAITLYDPKGNARLGLYADNTGGIIQMFDSSGNTVASLDGSNAPGLNFYRGQQNRISLGITDDGMGVLSLSDAAGNQRAAMGYSQKDDDATIMAEDKTGKEAAYMDLDANRSVIAVADATGTSRAGMICTADGSPELYIDDKNGKDVWTQTDQEDSGASASDNSRSNSSDGSSDNSGPTMHTPQSRDGNN